MQRMQSVDHRGQGSTLPYCVLQTCVQMLWQGEQVT